MPRTRVLLFGLLTATMASGYGVMFTVLDDFRDEYGIEAHWLGVIVGIGFLTAFVAQVFLAPIADRGHARRLVVAGMLLNVVGLVTMALGETLAVLAGGRFVSGIGIGMAVPAVRRIVINADPDHLGANVGLLLSADVAGFAVGPVVSALMVPSLGIPAPFLTIAAVTVCCLPIVFRVEVVEEEMSGTANARFAFDLLRDRALVAGLFMGAAVFLMIGTFDALWVIVLDDMDASELVANVGITVFALPLIFLGSYGGSLAQRIGPFRLGPFGLLIGASFMFCYGVLPTPALMLGFGVVHSMADGLTVSSAGVAVGMTARKERQAGAQGLLGATEAVSGGVTAMLAGILYSVGGRTLAFTTCAVLMVVLAVLAYVMAGDFRSRHGSPSDEPVVLDPQSAVTGHA